MIALLDQIHHCSLLEALRYSAFSLRQSVIHFTVELYGVRLQFNVLVDGVLKA